MTRLRISAAICLLLTAASAPAFADDACAGFTWDVGKERALFGTAAHSLAGGKNVQSAPSLSVDHLYELILQSQDGIQFAAAPGKKMLTDGAFAGLAKLQISMPGNYRIALDVPFWIDIVQAGKLLPSLDFQGRPGCNAPHKIVEFKLPATHDLIIQFSGATGERVRVSVTHSPTP
jgi:hypothetical protein